MLIKYSIIPSEVEFLKHITEFNPFSCNNLNDLYKIPSINDILLFSKLQIGNPLHNIDISYTDVSNL